MNDLRKIYKNKELVKLMEKKEELTGMRGLRGTGKWHIPKVEEPKMGVLFRKAINYIYLDYREDDQWTKGS